MRERLEQCLHAQLTLTLLGSIGPIRYSVRSVLGVRVVKHLLADCATDSIQCAILASVCSRGCCPEL
eukprot:9596245-Alexandrium_andersonii.AAC.1